MAKGTYRKPVKQDFGWLTTLPLPTKEQAVEYRKQLEKKYEEADVVRAMMGWSVRYRKPKK